MKPLGQKSYGSIPHLPGSRLGAGDHHCHEGQAIIATQKVRDKHDLVIVQEKLDGSNVSVAKVNGKILALTRSGYLAETSKYSQHLFFKYWVEENENRFFYLLKEGERVCGEWLALAHGTKYQLPHEPFVPFDLMTGTERMPYKHFATKVQDFNFTIPNLLHIGTSFSVDQALASIQNSGHGALEEVEGAIWRVERMGKVDFITKYVRPEKQDGKYFKEVIGEDVWNIDPGPWYNRWKKELGLINQ